MSKFTDLIKQNRLPVIAISAFLLVGTGILVFANSTSNQNSANANSTNSSNSSSSNSSLSSTNSSISSSSSDSSSSVSVSISISISSSLASLSNINSQTTVQNPPNNQPNQTTPAVTKPKLQTTPTQNVPKTNVNLPKNETAEQKCARITNNANLTNDASSYYKCLSENGVNFQLPNMNGTNPNLQKNEATSRGLEMFECDANAKCVDKTTIYKGDAEIAKAKKEQQNWENAMKACEGIENRDACLATFGIETLPADMPVDWGKK